MIAIAQSEVACPLCSSNSSRQIYRDDFVRVVRCNACDFMFQNPRAADTLEVEVEKDDSYYEGYASRIEPQRRLFDEKFQQHLGNRQPGRVLDLGCGSGVFMAVAASHGWEPTGIDVSPWALKKARSLGVGEVHEGVVEEIGFPDNHFDAIHMSHILEHIADPLKFLAEVRRILQPGGILLVEVPNEKTFRAQLRIMNLIRGGSVEKLTHPPMHLNLFTADSLRQTFQKAGFETLSVRAEGINKTRAATFVFSNTIPARIARLLGRAQVDVILGLSRWLYAVGRKPL